nr:hypothetical protein [Methylosinus sp. KRF6]
MGDRSTEARHAEAQEYSKHFQKRATLRRMRRGNAGAHWASPFRQRRRSKLRYIADPERFLDVRNLRDRVLEAVLAELLMLDFLEQLAHFVELMGGERVLPCGKNDRVLTGCMVFIHQLDAVQDLRQSAGVAGSYGTLADDSEDVIRQLSSPLVLRNENIHVGRRRAARLFDCRENMRLFEFFLVIVFAERSKHRRRAAEQLGIEFARLGAQFRGRDAIDEDRAADDAVLAHQVFDRANFLLLFFLARFGLSGCFDDFGVGSGQQEASAGGDDKTAASVVEFSHGRFLL